MKKIFILIIFTFLVSMLYAQPSRDWVTYFSGDYTTVSSVHYDMHCDCIYVAGVTADTVGISTPGAYKEVFEDIVDFSEAYYYIGINPDNFLVKMTKEGEVIWGTYYGSANKEYLPIVKTDRSGNVYLSGVGYIDSDDIGVTYHAYYYIAKFSPDGILMWNEHIGEDILVSDISESVGVHHPSIDFDNHNNVYFSGTICIDGLGTMGTYKPHLSVPDTIYMPVVDTYMLNVYPNDALLLKYDSNGVKQWGTYFGGGKWEYNSRVVCAPDGGVYLTGHTHSDTGIAYLSLYQDTIDSFMRLSSYLCRFNEDGQLEWSTYITGNGNIAVEDMQCDHAGNLYLYGYTISDSGIATAGAYQVSKNESWDLFLMKFSSIGEKQWGTYLGGEGADMPTSVQVSISDFLSNGRMAVNRDNGDIFFGGLTNSSTVLSTVCSYETQFEKKGLFAKFTSDGTMQWVSYYDAPIGDISINAKENITHDIFIVSRTNINGITTSGAHQETKPMTKRAGLIGRFTDDYNCGNDTLLVTQDASMLIANSGFDTYRWYHNDVLLSSTDTALILSDTTGYYYAIAEKCGCTYTSDTFYFEATSIDVLDEWSDITLYPNPVQEVMTLDLGKGIIISENTSLHILDMYGRVVLTRNITKGNYTSIELPTTSLFAGVYVLRLDKLSYIFTKR